MATMVEISVESLVCLGFLGGCAFVGLLALGVKAFTAWFSTDFEVERLRSENARLKAEADRAFNYRLALIGAGVKVA